MDKKKLKKFMERVEPGPKEECWEWQGHINPSGYGQLGNNYAHRLAYYHWVGPIPVGHVVHHTCGNRKCVNPSHLQPMSPSWHSQNRGQL